MSTLSDMDWWERHRAIQDAWQERHKAREESWEKRQAAKQRNKKPEYISYKEKLALAWAKEQLQKKKEEENRLRTWGGVGPEGAASAIERGDEWNRENRALDDWVRRYAEDTQLAQEISKTKQDIRNINKKYRKKTEPEGGPLPWGEQPSPDMIGAGVDPPALLQEMFYPYHGPRPQPRQEMTSVDMMLNPMEAIYKGKARQAKQEAQQARQQEREQKRLHDSLFKQAWKRVDRISSGTGFNPDDDKEWQYHLQLAARDPQIINSRLPESEKRKQILNKAKQLFFIKAYNEAAQLMKVLMGTFQSQQMPIQR